MPSLNLFHGWSNRHTVVAAVGALVLAGTAGGLAGALTGGGSATAVHRFVASSPSTRPATQPANPASPRPAAPQVKPPAAARPSPVTPARPVRAAPPVPITPVTRLTVDGYPSRITLTVPAGWHPSRTRLSLGCGCGGPHPTVCLVASGDYAHDPNNCVLVVDTADHAIADPDHPVPSTRLPKCNSWTTTDDATVTVAGIPAEYRQFLDSCDGSRSEQWVLAGAPGVAFWHPLTPASTHDDVLRAIESATIPARTSLVRIADVGYLRSLVHRADGVHVTIDRVVASLDGSVINYNPATYEYRIVPSSGSNGADCARYLTACSAAQLVAWFAKGAHPADGSAPLAGRLVDVYGGADGTMSFATLSPFRSYGDSGNGCGC